MSQKCSSWIQACYLSVALLTTLSTPSGINALCRNTYCIVVGWKPQTYLGCGHSNRLTNQTQIWLRGSNTCNLIIISTTETCNFIYVDNNKNILDRPYRHYMIHFTWPFKNSLCVIKPINRYRVDRRCLYTANKKGGGIQPPPPCYLFLLQGSFFHCPVHIFSH